MDSENCADSIKATSNLFAVACKATGRLELFAIESLQTMAAEPFAFKGEFDLVEMVAGEISQSILVYKTETGNLAIYELLSFKGTQIAYSIEDSEIFGN